MSPSSTEQETKSGNDQESVTCGLCGEVQPPELVEWWCETTAFGEPVEQPIQVCRAARSCCERMRDRTLEG